MEKKKISFLSRAAMMLFVMLLTTMTAWAENATTLSSTEGLKKVKLTGTGHSGHEWETDYRNLFDFNTNTQCNHYGWNSIDPDGYGYYIDFNSEAAFVPKAYSMTTGSDNSENPGRTPSSWKLKAKVNESDDWTTLVEVSGDNTMQDVNFTQYDFAIPSSVTTAYKYFRLVVNGTPGSNYETRMSEFYFWKAAEPNEPTYSITLPTTVEHGSIDLQVMGQPGTTANEGDRVAITFTNDEGYEITNEDIHIKDAANNDVNIVDKSYYTQNSFVYYFDMPASNVTVDAAFSVKKYYIRCPYHTYWDEGVGDEEEVFSIQPSVDGNDIDRAAEGATVTLTLKKTAGIVFDDDPKVGYYDKGSYNAPRKNRAIRGGENDNDLCYLTLTKLDDTHYTFVMPAVDVDVSVPVHYEGDYAVNLSGDVAADDGFRMMVKYVNAFSANEGDKVYLEFGTSGVENISVIDADNTPVSVNTESMSFTMPAKAVTVSANLKYQLAFSEEWGFLNYKVLSASVDGNTVEPYSYIAPGKTVTLTLTSPDEDIILSRLAAFKNNSERIALTKVNDTQYTFVMPSASVRIENDWGNPITVTFDKGADDATGSMDPITIGNGGEILLPEGEFTREGYTFAGWKRPNDEKVYTPGEWIGLDWYDTTITAQWASNKQTLSAKEYAGKYWTTYYCSYMGYEIDTDEEACAYTATLNNSTVTLHKLGKVIPANTAVVIVGMDNNISMTLNQTAEPEYTVENDLKGIDERTRCEELVYSGTFYILGMTTVNNVKHFGFHKYEGEYMAGGKAFFVIGKNNNYAARELDMIFDGETTNIEQVDVQRSTFNIQHIYDLQGRKVSNPTKGLYIINGKKVVIK